MSAFSFPSLMSKTHPLEYDRAAVMARELLEEMRPFCQLVAVAGSLRREKGKHGGQGPRDIELVYLDQAGDGDRHLNLLLEQGHIEQRTDVNGITRWGEKAKMGVYYPRKGGIIPVDFFRVLDPDQWGLILAIRTGSGNFNKLLVTTEAAGGACPLNRKVAGGYVWDLSNLPPVIQSLANLSPAADFLKRRKNVFDCVVQLPTTTEKEFFATLDVPYWTPRKRTEMFLRKYLLQRKRTA